MTRLMQRGFVWTGWLIRSLFLSRLVWLLIFLGVSYHFAIKFTEQRIERLAELDAQVKLVKERGDPGDQFLAERRRALAELELYLYGLMVVIPVSFLAIIIALILKSLGQAETHKRKELDSETAARNETLRSKVREFYKLKELREDSENW